MEDASGTSKLAGRVTDIGTVVEHPKIREKIIAKQRQKNKRFIHTPVD